MLRWISATVLAILIGAALVWRLVREDHRSGTSVPPPESSPRPSAQASETESLRAAAEPAAPASPEVAPQTTTSTPSPRAVLHGRLDDAVPRPIVEGHVRVHRLSSERVFDADVLPDGTFELADLPEGHAQVIALCRGWVSKRTTFDPVESATLRLGRELKPREIEQAFQEEPPESLEAQRIVLPARTTLVVAMERTGSLEVTVRDGDTPLEGARITVTPKVHWIGTEPASFPWGTWEGKSDPWGHARIDGLPPGEAISVDATHESGTTKRSWTYVVKITSGLTTELEVAAR